MPYFGHTPTNAGSFIEIDDYGSSFNGSTTAFTLQVGGVDVTPNSQNILVMIDGVVQMPTSAYAISGSTITYTEAPPSGADSYVILMGQSASIGQGTIGADELKISGDGTSGQLVKSDGDGTYSYVNQSAVTADANVLSGTTLKSTVVNSSLTSVGTLTSLNTTGAVTATGSDYMIKAVSTSTSNSNAIRVSAESGLAQGKIEIGWHNDDSRTGGGYGIIQVGKSANTPEISIMASKTLVGTTTAYRTNERLQVTGSEGIASKATTNGGGAFVAVEDSSNTSGSAFVNVDTGGNVNFKVGVGGYTTITGGTSATPLTIFRGNAGNLIQVGPTNTAHDASIYLRSNGIFNFHTPGGGSIRFSSGGSTALTLNSSQEATFESRLTLAGDGSGDGIFMGTGWQIFDNASESYGSTGSLVFFNGSQRVEMRENGTMYMAGGFQSGATLLGTVNINSTQYAVVGSNSSSRGIAICRDGSASFPDFRVEGNGNVTINNALSVGSISSSGNITVDTGGTSIITADGNNSSGDDGRILLKGHTAGQSRAYAYFNNGVSSGGLNWYVGNLRGSNAFTITCGNDDAPGYGGGSFNDTVIIIDGNRKMGIRGNPGSAILTVHGDITTTSDIINSGNLYSSASSGTHYCGLSNKRWNTVYGVNSNFSSDQTLKKNIKTSDLGIDFINSLNPVKFNWKKSFQDDTQNHYGFLAQEIVKTALADSVSGDEGEMGMNYSELIAPIVKAIQELSDKITALEGS
mgnify:FL=1